MKLYAYDAKARICITFACDLIWHASCAHSHTLFARLWCSLCAHMRTLACYATPSDVNVRISAHANVHITHFVVCECRCECVYMRAFPRMRYECAYFNACETNARISAHANASITMLGKCANRLCHCARQEETHASSVLYRDSRHIDEAVMRH